MATATKERTKTRARPDGIALAAGPLKAALSTVALAVGRTVNPIYQSVLLGSGVLTAGDGEMRIDVELENTPPGLNFLLPKDRFSAILGSFSGDSITFLPSNESCVITAGHGTWTLPTQAAAEYPPWPESSVKPVARIPADQFLRAINGTVYAADTESSRYALGAVLIEVKGDVVTFVATDGRRLCSVACEHDLAVDDSQTLVPSKVMAIMARIASRAGDSAVQLEASRNEVVVTIGLTRISARLVEGRYPKWREVVPTREVTPTVLLRSDLLAATKSAAICVSETSKGVEFVFAANGIWLHGQSSECGESSVTCEVTTAGQAASVKLDPQFVVDFLNGISLDAEPEIEVEALDGDSAVVLRCGDHTGVIMPLAKD